MQNLSVNEPVDQYFKEVTVTTVLHQCAKGLFGFYIVYNSFLQWVDTISYAFSTVIGGAIEGILYDAELSKKVKEDNELRRKADDSSILYDLKVLAEFASQPELNLSEILIRGDLSSLAGDYSDATKVEGLRSIEKYPLHLRRLLAGSINALISSLNGNSIPQSPTPSHYSQERLIDLLESINVNSSSSENNQITTEQELFRQISESRHKYRTQKVDRITQKLLIKLLDMEKYEFLSHEAVQEFLFNFGRNIGEVFKTDSATNHDLKTLLELILLVGVYSTLYVVSTLKSVILKPFEIFKCLVLGAIAGVHKDILRDNPEIEVMLIDLESPINELTFTFKSHYESIAYRNDDDSIYSAGKKCPMKTIEKLIAVKSEFLIRKLRNPHLDSLKSLAHNDLDFQLDIGAAITRDNPSVLFFAAINTIDDIVNKLAITIGYIVGEKLGSFCSYVKDKNSIGSLNAVK